MTEDGNQILVRKAVSDSAKRDDPYAHPPVERRPLGNADVYYRGLILDNGASGIESTVVSGYASAVIRDGTLYYANLMLEPNLHHFNTMDA